MKAVTLFTALIAVVVSADVSILSIVVVELVVGPMVVVVVVVILLKHTRSLVAVGARI